jgi:hypothetical protein
MQDAAAFLHATVMPAPNDLAVVDDHGAYGDTAFREPLFGFFNRGLEKWVVRIHTRKTLPPIVVIAGIAKIQRLPIGSEIPNLRPIVFL